MRRKRRSSLRMVLLERRGRAEVGERRTMVRNRRVVAAPLQQLHSLASCLLLRFSSARPNIPLRVHRIRPHRQTLPVPPLHRIPTILRPRAEAPPSEAGEGEEAEEEEAETEEEHHRLLRTRIREESIQLCLYCIAHHHGVIRICLHSSAEGDADFSFEGRHLCRLS